jgi:hypothetical protein
MELELGDDAAARREDQHNRSAYEDSVSPNANRMGIIERDMSRPSQGVIDGKDGGPLGRFQ